MTHCFHSFGKNKQKKIHTKAIPKIMIQIEWHALRNAFSGDLQVIWKFHG